MKRFAITICLFTVAGCVRASMQSVTTPDGTAGWCIECPDDHRACSERADAQCPHGYLTVGEPEHRGSMTIRCR